MLSRFAENRLQPQWRSLIFGNFGRNSGTPLFKDYFYAFSPHVTIQGIELCGLKCGNTGMCRNFRLLHLKMELLLTNSAAAAWFLVGNLLTFFCNLWLPRRAHTHNSFRLRACDNGNPIEIGF
jgi:hypothetical protein